MLNIKEKYEDMKTMPSVLVEYDEILSFYPDYYKEKVEIEKMKFNNRDKRSCLTIFNKMYKDSELYKNLIESGMTEEEAYDKMKNNMILKRKYLFKLCTEVRNSCLDLLNLIDYIGHYPDKFPVADTKDLNPEMEVLLEKYDIIVRYYMYDDLDKMMIYGDDIVRIIETLRQRKENLKRLAETFNDDGWMVVEVIDAKELIEELPEDIEKYANYFPKSYYEKLGKSKREEGLEYQKNMAKMFRK